ncbi:hypothetical protein P389DRAFT_208646 [Cystobasidium minutum MCA 4210]|uniref:uncharacterized protein n=1 Tax=Cystobasidium minutum MCA 4210 TaxID=1397322 RepID=UPI0034CF1175|eukprot:jgi/Rhomi1/208646/estExt_Genemark1.C_2_t10358
MAAESTSATPRSDDAIRVEVGNAKLFGKRCTARIDAGEFNEALQDAKTLVRLLPGAPIGYLKAARCYRLLKKLKAAQKMLDAAVERADYEGTIRAARTEQRKIAEDARALADERSRPFANQLPEEIFLHIASYLSQRDLVRAAQVNQTWRNVLHSRPQLWTTMYLNLTAKDFRKAPSAKASPTNCRIKFYEERLPEDGGRHLLHLSIHVRHAPPPEVLDNGSLMSEILCGRHRFASNGHLQSLAFSGEWQRLPAFLKLAQAPSSSLSCVRFAGAGALASKMFSSVYPNLRAFDAITDDRSAEYYQDDWPYRASDNSDWEQTAGNHADPECRVTPERYVTQAGIVFNDGDAGPPGTEYLNGVGFKSCRHLEIGGEGSFSTFFTKSPMTHLRTLVLHNALFNVSFPFPSGVDSSSATGVERIADFLQPPLELPVLETFKIYYIDVTGSSQAITHTRHTLRPTVYFCRLKAPRLRHLTIKKFGPILPSPPSVPATHARERNAWSTFCQNHPHLEELVLHKTTITDLAETLPLLKNVSKLLLSHADLSSNFLKSATSPTALPKLKQLQVSHCSSITSGDLLRLVKSKDGGLDYLDIEACTELQKEAVDWLKANVKQVKWTGWRDKNDNRRPFGFRA